MLAFSYHVVSKDGISENLYDYRDYSKMGKAKNGDGNSMFS